MSRNISTLILSACILSLLSSCGVRGTAGGATPPESVAVRIISAASSDVPLDLTAIGTVEALSTVEVKSRITGLVLRANFNEGQDVKQGDVLFDLDPEPITRQISELDANLARDIATEKQVRANIVRDQAQLRNAQAQADRSMKLAKDGIVSREQTEQVVSVSDAARASLEADEAAAESAAAAVRADRARLASTNLQLSYTKIVAPMSGKAGTIPVKAGNLVKENETTLVTLLQMSPVFVTFAVPENRLAEVRRSNSGQPLRVAAALSGGGGSAIGTLQFIDNTADPTTGMIKLKGRFENTGRELWPGQFINVSMQLEMERNRTLVPARTVQTGLKGKYVWVMNRQDSTVTMRFVQVLRNYTPLGGGEQAVIAAGLKPGETVISEGQSRLAPGAKVRVLPATGV